MSTKDKWWSLKILKERKTQQTITDDCNVLAISLTQHQTTVNAIFDSKRHRVRQHVWVCQHVEPLTATKKWGDVGWNWTHWISSFNLLNGCCQQQSHDDVSNMKASSSTWHIMRMRWSLNWRKTPSLLNQSLDSNNMTLLVCAYDRGNVAFLADRTNNRAYATVLRLSSVTLFIVTKWCVLKQKLLLTACRKSYMRNRLPECTYYLLLIISTKMYLLLSVQN